MASVAGTEARFPLPGLAIALLLLALLHGPLLGLPAVLDEGPFLAGIARSSGSTLAMHWLPFEVSLFGTDAAPHRAFALLLEVLVVCGSVPLLRRCATPDLGLIALAAWLVHPWRTESFVRLGARGVVLAEVLALGAAWLALRRRAWGPWVAGLLAALATSAAPGLAFVALAAVPLVAAPVRWRALVVAAFALLGVLFWGLAAPSPALASSAWCAFDLLLRPWATGLEHVRADPIESSLGAAVMLALMATAWRRRDAVAALLGCMAVCAWSAALVLRPPRTGLDYLGAGATPESWLPLLLLLFALLVRLAAGGRWRALPLLAFASLAVAGGFVQARRFDPPLQLIDHAIEVAPESVELQVLRGQLWLAQGSAAPRAAARSFADAALARVGQALSLRPGDPAARTLEVMALALLARLDEARQKSDLLLAAFPDDWRARVARAEVEAIAGDTLGALRWMRAAVAVADTPQVRAKERSLLDQIYGELRTLLADRRYGEARSRALALRTIAPEELPAQEAYVDTFTLAGELPQALTAAEALFATSPRRASVVQRLAVLHERLGHAEAAARFQRLLRELSPAGATP